MKKNNSDIFENETTVGAVKIDYHLPTRWCEIFHVVNCDEVKIFCNIFWKPQF